MKTKIGLLILVFSLISFTGVSLAIKPDPVPGPIQNVYEPKTKFWMEKFQGGGPGEEGNVLMAIGQGFVFQHAVLEEALPNGDGTYTTTYIGGELTLNPSGPWGRKMKGKKPFRTLKASDITAKNVSAFDPATGSLKFTLTFGGKFDNADLSYCATATYDGYPQFKYDLDGKPVFQRGFWPDFKAEIVFANCPNQ